MTSLIIDVRDHIGGNCYDYIDSHGIRASKCVPPPAEHRSVERHSGGQRDAALHPPRPPARPARTSAELLGRTGTVHICFTPSSSGCGTTSSSSPSGCRSTTG